MRGMQQALRYRITPACAGKRIILHRDDAPSRDHPRVCGEKDNKKPAAPCSGGSPPRVRGKGDKLDKTFDEARITPACAGKSRKPSLRQRKRWDHPRVCGEKDPINDDADDLPGSPPRVRGKAVLILDDVPGVGITPACAGKRCADMSKFGTNGDHPRVCGEKMFQLC